MFRNIYEVQRELDCSSTFFTNRASAILTAWEFYLEDYGEGIDGETMREAWRALTEDQYIPNYCSVFTVQLKED